LRVHETVNPGAIGLDELTVGLHAIVSVSPDTATDNEVIPRLPSFLMVAVKPPAVEAVASETDACMFVVRVAAVL